MVEGAGSGIFGDEETTTEAVMLTGAHIGIKIPLCLEVCGKIVAAVEKCMRVATGIGEIKVHFMGLSEEKHADGAPHLHVIILCDRGFRIKTGDLWGVYAKEAFEEFAESFQSGGKFYFNVRPVPEKEFGKSINYTMSKEAVTGFVYHVAGCPVATCPLKNARLARISSMRRICPTFLLLDRIGLNQLMPVRQDSIVQVMRRSKRDRGSLWNTILEEIKVGARTPDSYFKDPDVEVRSLAMSRRSELYTAYMYRDVIDLEKEMALPFPPSVHEEYFMIWAWTKLVNESLTRTVCIEEAQNLYISGVPGVYKSQFLLKLANHFKCCMISSTEKFFPRDLADGRYRVLVMDELVPDANFSVKLPQLLCLWSGTPVSLPIKGCEANVIRQKFFNVVCSNYRLGDLMRRAGVPDESIAALERRFETVHLTEKLPIEYTMLDEMQSSPMPVKKFKTLRDFGADAYLEETEKRKKNISLLDACVDEPGWCVWLTEIIPLRNELLICTEKAYIQHPKMSMGGIDASTETSCEYMAYLLSEFACMGMKFSAFWFEPGNVWAILESSAIISVEQYPTAVLFDNAIYNIDTSDLFLTTNFSIAKMRNLHRIDVVDSKNVKSVGLTAKIPFCTNSFAVLKAHVPESEIRMVWESAFGALENEEMNGPYNTDLSVQFVRGQFDIWGIAMNSENLFTKINRCFNILSLDVAEVVDFKGIYKLLPGIINPDMFKILTERFKENYEKKAKQVDRRECYLMHAKGCCFGCTSEAMYEILKEVPSTMMFIEEKKTLWRVFDAEIYCRFAVPQSKRAILEFGMKLNKYKHLNVVVTCIKSYYCLFDPDSTVVERVTAIEFLKKNWNVFLWCFCCKIEKKSLCCFKATEDVDICALCQYEIKRDDHVCVCRNKHAMHYKCGRRWKGNCALCKHEFYSTAMEGDSCYIWEILGAFAMGNNLNENVVESVGDGLFVAVSEPVCVHTYPIYDSQKLGHFFAGNEENDKLDVLMTETMSVNTPGYVFLYLYGSRVLKPSDTELTFVRNIIRYLKVESTVKILDPYIVVEAYDDWEFNHEAHGVDGMRIGMKYMKCLPLSFFETHSLTILRGCTGRHVPCYLPMSEWAYLAMFFIHDVDAYMEMTEREFDDQLDEWQCFVQFCDWVDNAEGILPAPPCLFELTVYLPCHLYLRLVQFIFRLDGPQYAVAVSNACKPIIMLMGQLYEVMLGAGVRFWSRFYVEVGDFVLEHPDVQFDTENGIGEVVLAGRSPLTRKYEMAGPSGLVEKSGVLVFQSTTSCVGAFARNGIKENFIF